MKPAEYNDLGTDPLEVSLASLVASSACRICRNPPDLSSVLLGVRYRRLTGCQSPPNSKAHLLTKMANNSDDRFTVVGSCLVLRAGRV